MKDYTKQHQQTLKRLRKQLAELDIQTDKVRAAIVSIEDVLGVSGVKVGASGNAIRPRYRARKSPLVAAAVAVLRDVGTVVHIRDLVRGIQERGQFTDRSAEKLRPSLVSTLLRREDTFTNPKRGHYGLTEWSGNGSVEPDALPASDDRQPSGEDDMKEQAHHVGKDTVGLNSDP